MCVGAMEKSMNIYELWRNGMGWEKTEDMMLLIFMKNSTKSKNRIMYYSYIVEKQTKKEEQVENEEE